MNADEHAGAHDLTFVYRQNSRGQLIFGFRWRVAVRADDGTTVENSAVVQIPLGATRQVTIPFDQTLTSLEFIKILDRPGAGCSN